jgi:hypothetical protein
MTKARPRVGRAFVERGVALEVVVDKVGQPYPNSTFADWENGCASGAPILIDLVS